MREARPRAATVAVETRSKHTRQAREDAAALGTVSCVSTGGAQSAPPLLHVTPAITVLLTTTGGTVTIVPGSLANLILPSGSAVFHTEVQPAHLERPALAELSRGVSREETFESV